MGLFVQNPVERFCGNNCCWEVRTLQRWSIRIGFIFELMGPRKIKQILCHHLLQFLRLKSKYFPLFMCFAKCLSLLVRKFTAVVSGWDSVSKTRWHPSSSCSFLCLNWCFDLNMMSHQLLNDKGTQVGGFLITSLDVSGECAWIEWSPTGE